MDYALVVYPKHIPNPNTLMYIYIYIYIYMYMISVQSLSLTLTLSLAIQGASQPASTVTKKKLYMHHCNVQSRITTQPSVTRFSYLIQFVGQLMHNHEILMIVL
jgi:hypothetical protein